MRDVPAGGAPGEQQVLQIRERLFLWFVENAFGGNSSKHLVQVRAWAVAAALCVDVFRAQQV